MEVKTSDDGHEHYKAIPKLVLPVVIAVETGVSVERLYEMARAGYMPCWWVDGHPMFQKGKAKQWIRANLVSEQKGEPFSQLTVVTCPTYAHTVNTDIPMPLIQIDNLMSLPVPTSQYPTAVYFLCWEGEVVYVGQTTQLLARIGQHSKDKTFDKVFYIPVPESKLVEVESMYIHAIKPKINLTPVKDRLSPGQ